MIISNETIAIYREVLEVIAAIAAVGVLISSLDDLFIDVYYWVRKIYRWVTLSSKHKPLRVEQLLEKEESYLAIMVPAWQEHDVIAKMVENTIATMNYQKYVIFLGTYQNDAQTTAEADRMARRFPTMVRRATVLNDGPTCKADCLNWIAQSIFLYEEQHNIKFAGLIIHDSEDVIHPLEFRMFNFLVGRKDLIQMPVLSLERGWWDWIAASYMDDFAEWHEKEMVVRESLNGLVPGSGVSTCYSRRAIQLLADKNKNQPFNTDTLTEDYDLSFRLKELGTTQVFVRFPVLHAVKRKSFFTGKEYQVNVNSVIATREYFPSTLRTAYRQRARWILGVAFQGWQQMGWKGGLASKYLFFRDRKSLWVPYVGLLTYLTAGSFMTIWLLRLMGLEYMRFPDFVETRSWLFYCYLLSFWFFFNRVFHRAYFVSLEHGIVQGFLSIPRMVVGSVINLAAVSRAWKIFVTHLITGKRIAWDKTQHFYPTVEALKKLRKQTGELLLSWNQISQEQLDHALSQQKITGKRVGRLLLEQGAISQEKLADAMADQTGLPRTVLEPQAIKQFFGRLPGFLVQRHSVIPFAEAQDGTLNLAVYDALSDDALAIIQEAVGRPVALFIATEQEITAAVGWYGVGGDTAKLKAGPAERKPLGDFLVEVGAVTVEALASSLSGYNSERDGRIGEYLLARGVISQAQLDDALHRQSELANELANFNPAPWNAAVDALKKLRKQTGELLLSWNQISQEQLDHALSQQKITGKRVGRLLLEQGAISQGKLADAIAEQAGLPRIVLEPQTIKQFFGRLPAFLVQRHGVVPFAEAPNGTLSLAVFDTPSDEVLAAIQKAIGHPVALFIATEQEISAAVGWYSAGDDTVKIKAMPVARKPLGDFLIEIGAVTVETLVGNLSGYNSGRDGQIGAYLLARGVISQAQLDEALRRQGEASGGLENSNSTLRSAAR
ncbi:MAG: glycosyl transferase family protein [Gallionella sp.]|nr:glycosyl transferase family protein [Gallionella sp.]